MPVMKLNDKDLVQVRILYTALIKTVLIAWRQGYAVANPQMDVRYLARNNHLVINAIVSYFQSVPLPVGIKSKEISISDFLLPDGAEQLIPMADAISKMHYSVIHSGQKYANRITGKNSFDTIRNMIIFYEEQPG